MAYGYIVEKKIAASDVDALNANAVTTGTTNVDGGMAVALGAYDKGVYTVSLPGATAFTGMWMAYNPTEHLTVVNGKYFAGLSADPRDYTNLATRPFDIFKPQVGDIIGFTAANFGSNQVPDATTNKYVATAADGLWVAGASSISAGKMALTCLAVENLPFPQAGIGLDYQALYVCVVTAN